MNRAIKTLIAKPGKVLISFSVVVVLAVLATGLLRFEQDIMAILPQNDRAFQLISHTIKASDGQDKLYILLSGASNSESLLQTGEKLVHKLRQLKLNNDQLAFKSATMMMAEAVSSKDFEELLIGYLTRPETFLTPADLAEIESFLNSPTQIDHEVRRSLALLATPGAPQLTRIVSLDPLNFRRFLINKLQGMHNGMSFADGPEMISADGQALLLITTPSSPATNRQDAHQLMTAIDQLKKEFPGVEIGLTGGYAMAAQEEALMRGDILNCLGGSVLGIGLLFLLAYRRISVLLFIILPLGVGLQLALGVMALTWGKVHMIAVAFAAVVLGLGVDFAIHVYDRYTSERLAGNSQEISAHSAIFRTGSAVLVGGLTSLTAFLVLTLTDSPVLQQIGWLVALGLLFCLTTILWALPAWLIWLEKSHWGKTTRPFHLFGIHHLGRWINAKPGLALTFSVAVLLLALPGVKQIGFERDLASLHPKGLEAIKVRQNIQAHFNNGTKPLMLSWQATDTDSFWQQGRDIDIELKKLQSKQQISSWTSLTGITAGQKLHLPGLNPALVNSSLALYGLQAGDFKYLTSFLTAFSKQEEGDNNFLSMLPKLHQRFFLRDSEKTSGITWVNSPSDEATAQISAAMAKLDRDILLVSPDQALTNIMDSAKSGLLKTAGWALALIMIILFVFFRNISRVFLALSPTVLALITTTGIMGYLGIRINPINFIIIPILIGIGLDDGIHIIDRYRETGDIQKTLASTGRSIFLTSLTTCLGFGSLALAQYHVLSNMGVLTIIGVTSCFLFSTVTLSAILKLQTRKI